VRPPRACRAPAPLPRPLLCSLSAFTCRRNGVCLSHRDHKDEAVRRRCADRHGRGSGHTAPCTSEACPPSGRGNKQQAAGAVTGATRSDDAGRQAQRTGTTRRGNNAHRQHTPAVLHLESRHSRFGQWPRPSSDSVTGVPFVSRCSACVLPQPWCLPRCSTRATPSPRHGAWVSLRPSRRASISPSHCARYSPASATSTEVTAGQVTLHSDCSHHFCLLLRPLFSAQLGHPG
jgi:hypothetical protein